MTMRTPRLKSFHSLMGAVGIVLCLVLSKTAFASCVVGNLPLGGSSTGNLDSTHTSDTWCVDVAVDGSLGVNVVDDAALAVNVYLYDEDLRLLGSDLNSDGDQTVQENNVAPGTYYVLVARESGVGGYQISSSFTAQPLANDAEPNNDSAQALVLGLGASASGHLGYVARGVTDTSDWYKLTTTVDGSLRVNVVDDAALSVLVYLYDEDFRTLDSDTVVDGDLTVQMNNLSPGIYYVRVLRYSGVGGYQITATASGPNILAFPGVIDFGPVDLGSVSAPRTLTVKTVASRLLSLGPHKSPVLLRQTSCCRRILFPARHSALQPTELSVSYFLPYLQAPKMQTWRYRQMTLIAR